MRKDFEMTQADVEKILDACKPIPMVMLQCGPIPTVQERANAAWKELGDRMGFDHMSVRPTGRGDRFFSAEAKDPAPKPHVKKDGSSWCATWPDFVNLQESPAGFGDTPEEAIAALGDRP